MLKDRFSDESAKPHAQRMLAFTLDCLLRLLHPVMPFITEEIWQNLAKLAPQRGLTTVDPASECLIAAEWPTLDPSWQDAEIESQFAIYQKTLGALREIRSRQNSVPEETDSVCHPLRTRCFECTAADGWLFQKHGGR